jgi:hypothetical protein
MVKFCKNADCPPSESLLEFQAGTLSQADRARIRRHLPVCEFCAAEVDLYKYFPIPPFDANGAAEPAAMPKHLMELAEALLTKIKDDELLDKLMGQEGGLSYARH